LKFRIEKASGIFLTESRLSKDQVVVDLGEKLEFTATVVGECPAGLVAAGVWETGGGFGTGWD
jgi:hypothetical protein